MGSTYSQLLKQKPVPQDTPNEAELRVTPVESQENKPETISPEPTEGKSELASAPSFQKTPPPKPMVIPTRDGMTPRQHDATPSRRHDGTPAPYFEPDLNQITDTVKGFGKEKGTYRITEDEKSALEQVVFNLRAEGHKTTENVIIRIALSYLLQDHEYNSESVISKVMKQLQENSTG